MKIKGTQASMIENVRTLRTGAQQSMCPAFSLLSTLALLTVGSLLFAPASAQGQGGVPIWTNRYDSGRGDDGASGIAVGRNGTVFITGSSRNGGAYDCVTVAYSNAGLPLWTNSFPAGGEAIAVDASDNVFVATGAATIKYSNAGVPLWTNTGFSSAIALDNNGNVFTSDAFSPTRAYSNSGVPLWTDYYNGGGNAYAIAADGGGNVFVTGGYIDYTTIKYSNAGVSLWTNRFNGRGNGNDAALGIAVDLQGNAFVTGSEFVSPSSMAYATIKYSDAGVPLWTNHYGTVAEPRAIALDSAGNAFVTGYSSLDYATVAYSSSGTPLWTRQYNGPGNGSDQAFSIAVDSAGNIFVTGESVGAGTATDIATVAYSNTGTPLWTNRYNGPANGHDSARAIAVDRSGNVFVSGSSYDGTNYGYLTIKYSSSVPPPHLDFQRLNNQLVLSWTNAGLNLQSAPAVTGTFTNVPGATSPYTNSTISTQRYFRLAAP